MTKYFWDPPGKELGLNADIQRHREMEAEFDEKILELESKSDERSIAALRTYRHFRCQLLASKAELVSKLGRQS